MRRHFEDDCNMNFYTDLLEGASPESALDRPLLTTRFSDQFAKSKKTRTLCLREIADDIKRTSAASKADLPWLKLAAFGAEKSEKGSYRTNSNMRSIDGIELDYDAGEISPSGAADMLEEAGLAALIYTTPSHQQPGKGNHWRALLPTSGTLAPADREALVARVQGVLDGVLDPASFTDSQAYFYGCEQGSRPVKTILVDGDFIDHAGHLDSRAIGRDGKPYRSRREVEIADNDNRERRHSPAVAGEALLAIPNVGDRYWWFRLAGAAKSAGVEFEVFDQWSEQHESYSARHTLATWKSLNPDKPSGVTERTLYAEAERHDWRDPLKWEQILHDFDMGMDEDRQREKIEREADDKSFLTPVSSLAGKPVPEREWLIADLIPHRQVTDLSGDGGTGKSTLALQLATAVATGSEFLGLPVNRQGGVLVIAAEDELDEVHRRFAGICRETATEMADLNNIFVRSMAGENALLAEAARNGMMKETPFYKRLERLLSERRYSLLIADTRSHLYGGEANDTKQVTQFVNMLKHLAIKYDCAVLLLSHPSLTGMNSGTGSGFSVAWNNAVRSRLYLDRVKNADGSEDDSNARVLRTMKANYGPTGGEISMAWRRGIFVPDVQLAEEDAMLPADKLFLVLLKEVTAQGRHVSANTGPTYAPVVFEGMPKAGGTKKFTFAHSMERLLQSGEIVIREHGKGNSKRKHLERARHNREDLL